MPQRYIKIPEEILLRHPVTGEPAKTDQDMPDFFTFRTLLNRLLSNPKWTENYTNVRSADAVVKAYDDAKDGVMVLAEEDWKKLEEATQNPKQVIIHPMMGPQIQAGYGLMPSAVPQILPHLDAIVNAVASDPRVK